jgi:Ca2+-binding RTX toxin-like protein
MTGGAGDDVYVVNSASDIVDEQPGEGIDRVQSTATHTLSASVENLTLTGTGNIGGTGNELDNRLEGNRGNNNLNGGAGFDTAAFSGARADYTFTYDDNGTLLDLSDDSITVADSVALRDGTDRLRSIERLEFADQAVTAPVITSDGGGDSAALTVEGSTTAVTTVTASDADAGAMLTFSIAGGADAASFTIDATSGELSFVATPDSGAPADADGDNVYDVVVQVSDGVFLDRQAIAVTVTSVNEAPVITSNGGEDTAAVTVAENTLAVADVDASDADPTDILTYSIVGGADQALFTIDAATGALSFLSAPDAEAMGDADGDNVYDVVVEVSDGERTDSQAIAVTVSDVNEFDPAIAGGDSAAVTIDENGNAVTTVSASDADLTASVTYSIAGGADAALFQIDESTGALSFISAPDAEAMADADGDNVYDVVVEASDGERTDSQAIAVTVSDVNEFDPVIDGGDVAAVSIDENSLVVADVDATDGDLTASLTYSIAGGADAGLFQIDESTGVLSFISAPDAEAMADYDGDNVYDVVVEVSDGERTDSQAIAVTVNDVNEFAPVITSNGAGMAAAVTVVENSLAVADVDATDADLTASLTYSIVGGADQSLFTIDVSTGALSFISAPDAEAMGDADGDNVYDVTVQVSDGQRIDSQAIAVTVNDVNEFAPVITSNGGDATAAVTVAENSLMVADVDAADADLTANLTYSIVGGADSGRFSIDSATGVLSFIAAPDAEAIADYDGDNVYDVTVQVSDGQRTDTQAIAVTVSDVNEFDPVITSNGAGMAAAVTVAENSLAVTDVDATDADLTASLTYSIVGGADQALLTIDAVTGVLSFSSAPDAEAMGDADGDNVYDVVVQVSDGERTDSQAIAVTVSDVNEFAPVIAGGEVAAVPIDENSLQVADVDATDADLTANLTYSIAGGADQSLFTIDAATGVLSFIAAPDAEAMADYDGDNVYDVTVEVSDGQRTDSQAIAVTVSDVNEFAPVITSNGAGMAATVTVAENSLAVTDVDAIDADLTASLTYSIVGGADQALFTIDASSGALSFSSAPDAEAMADYDGDNVYDVTVQVSDGERTDSQAIAVTVSDVNEFDPVITSNGGDATAAVTVVENSLLVTDVDASASDLTANLSFSIVGGADAARFEIDASTGALSFISAPDAEAMADYDGDNVYDVVVEVSDGERTDSQAIAVTVSDVNEFDPVIAGGDSVSVTIDENGNAVTTVSAADADVTASVTYSIAGGDDAALFQIDESTGALSFISAPNAEGGGDNVYDVVVEASDGERTDSQAIAVTVSDVNEFHPVISSNGGEATAAVTVAENSLVVANVDATDADLTASLSYSIVGGADQALFAINGSTGELSFIEAPDAESGGDNVYDVVVQVSDGERADSQAIAVTVSDVNEFDPVIAGGDSASVTIDENGNAVSTVSATDADVTASVTYSIVGGDDAALFQIDEATGALSFINAPNAEGGGDNVYDVVVEASDGERTDSQAIAVTVEDVNEFDPVITSNGGDATAAVTVPENSLVVANVNATDADLTASLTYSVVGGADRALFAINGSTGELSFIEAPDAESGGDNIYDVVVQVSDGERTDSQAIAVTVSDVNEFDPVIAGGDSAAVSIDENLNAVTIVEATDADLTGSVTFSIAGGADAALFQIDEETGALTFISAPNAESGGDNVYDVVVEASDGERTDTQAISITVEDVNEFAPVISSNGGEATAAVTVAENSLVVADVDATDADLTANLSYSIVGGADSLRFQIDGSTGALSFISAPDAEAPGSADGDNIYDVTVQVSDGERSDSQAISVTVQNVNDVAPAITSAAAATVQENTTAVLTVTAEDADGPARVFSIDGGADAALFTIDAASGALSFLAAPDFEAPADADHDNVYDVQVRVSDGELSSTQAIAVTVADVNEAPVISSNGGGDTASVSVEENSSAVTTVTTAAPAPDGTTRTFSIVGGADAGRFTITAAGVLAFATAPDFEAPTDAGGNNVYDVVVQVADGAFTDTQALAVTVTNVAGVTRSGTAGADSLVGTAEEDRLNGFASNDTLSGGAGNDTLDGGLGSDSMVGGLGDDTYYVEVSSDAVVESAGGGRDGVRTTLTSYTLGANVEDLTYTGTSNFTGTGNAESNRITGAGSTDVLTGNAGNDTLEGMAGIDRLDGGDGDDWLDGGTQGDQLLGGNGNDTYVVDAGDSITELVGAGVDTVRTALSTYSLGTHLDNLTYTGSGNFTGTGNSLANVITGGAGNDTLSGGLNNDTMYGGAGDDRLTGGSVNDWMDGGAGNDVFVFAAGFGQDTIAGFDASPDTGAGSVQDRLDVSGLGITAATFASQVAITIVGADTLVQIGADSILLAGVNGLGDNAITSTDFILAS